ncbi:IS66 family insertion sequence element accessory protein TnpA [Pseudobacteroides cellulosolvens]|uniref:Uncharacterized protein n=1 Tax=Pseudobacteroides cellulosolvens ATCC 35603 = DSM 2933 TaxID=398512 RepID=A0A0L6JRK2_9FIRM|nr:hypothetical protein [Pseudobacteroides cellulosolvens]KNY28315.1 hypothetical protein Bccel_3589 [Pseudobacteroides cellulosolvens ATCC 35603 = DSM 2933]
MSSNMKYQIWKERIADYSSSNLKAQEWCNKNNLSIKTFYYWLRRFNKETISSSNTPNEFVPVTVTTQDIIINNTSVPIVIRLGNIAIDVADGCQTDNLRKVLEVLGVYA